MEKLNNLENEILKKIKGMFVGIVVDLAATTPFDTGYHAINWKLSTADDTEEVESYDKKNRRNFQNVLNNVYNRANNFKMEDVVSFVNNGKMYEDLENGNPTAGTGPNANPGFVKAVENTVLERKEELIKKINKDITQTIKDILL